MTLGSVPCKLVVTAVLAVLLAACRSPAPPQTTSAPASGSNGSRYALENDIAVNEPIDLNAIREVVPQVEPRTSAGNKSPYTINGRTYRVLQDERNYSEVGVASWYGRKFHGHLTSNGEKYDMFQLSAAHTTLPIPSYIRVTNLDNGRSVIARVNDRGPFHPGRVVDMSYAGAVLLGYANKGTARVRVESIVPGNSAQVSQSAAPAVTQQAPPSEPRSAAPVVFATTSVESVATERQLIEEDKGAEYLQIGAFATESSARNLQTRLQGMTMMGVVIHQETAANGTLLYKVRVGPLAGDAAVQSLQDAVAAARLGTPFKVRL